MRRAEALGALAGAARVLPDLAYGPDALHRLDLYLPDTPNPPLVAYLHGGGWHTGSRHGYDQSGPFALAECLAAGLAFAALDYRLTPAAVWPAQRDDLTAAFAFLRGNGAMGYDAARLAVMGDSAGGHLGAIMALALASKAQTQLRAAVLSYPPTDLVRLDADMDAMGRPAGDGDGRLPESSVSALIGGPVAGNEALCAATSPLTALAKMPKGVVLPRFLILHGALDPTVAPRQSLRLVEALALHIPAPDVEFALLSGAGHGDAGFEAHAPRVRAAAFLATAFG